MSFNPVSVILKELFEDVRFTYLSADVAAAASALTVESIKEFAINQILQIGELGSENSEIIKTHAATAPTGSTITLASALTFAHDQGTKIYIIPFDKIEFSWAATEAGSKSVLSTEDIEADSLDTLYTDTAKTTGYFFTRYKNSIDNSYSSYSDPIPIAGFGSNTVNFAIEYALRRNKLDTFTENVSHDFCIDEINDCLVYIAEQRKKWHRLQDFDYSLGTTAQGEWKFAVPSTMWGYSNKSVLAIGLEGEDNLIWKDEREWNEILDGVYNTTLSGAASIGATEITLTDSSGFEAPTSGTATVMIDGQEITYTTNTVATGVLSGIPASGTGSITANLTDAAQVWQGDYETGNPLYYTIKEGYVYVWPLPSSSYDDRVLYIDFWKEAPSIDSDADTLDISRFGMVKYWLVWAVRSQTKNEGMRNFEDGDWLMFEKVLKKAMLIESQTHGQKYKMKPKINTISY